MSIELNINRKLAQKVTEVSEQLNMDSNELIIKAIKRFLHAQEITLLRKDLKGIAQKNGFSSEEDIYKAVS